MASMIIAVERSPTFIITAQITNKINFKVQNDIQMQIDANTQRFQFIDLKV